MSQNNANPMADALSALLGGDTSTNASAAKKERVPSILWLNIGVSVPGKDGAEPTFVSLPFGLPLDDMKHVEIKGKNVEWHKLATAKNALLDAIRKQGSGMEAGSEVVLPGLTVQLLRKAEGSAAGPDSENELLQGLAAALGG